MNNFLRRLKLYGIGFGIGIVFVFFFFQNRGCTWLPSNRVKNTILGRVLIVNENQQAIFTRHGISEKEAVDFLNDGDIRFGNSKKKGNPLVYSVTKEVNGKNVELWFTLPDNSFISEIQFPKGSIQRAGNSTEGVGKMIHFPNVESIVYLDSNRRLTCQQDYSGLIAPKQVFDQLKSSGKIDFARSHLDVSPQPEHYVIFNDPKGRKIASKTVWYQEHIRFFNWILADSTVCK